MPTSVSAIRMGAFPSRGSGVTVFVTNASSWRTVSGAVSASEAAGGVEDHQAAARSTGPSMQSRFQTPSISTAQP